MARSPSPLALPLPPNLGFLAQRRRGLFRHPDQPPSQARRLPIRRRPPGRHPSLPRSLQRPVETLPVGRRSRQNHRRRQARAPSVGFDPLGAPAVAPGRPFVFGGPKVPPEPTTAAGDDAVLTGSRSIGGAPLSAMVR